MFAAHFAAGLALEGRAPRAPLWSLLVGAFLLDFLWILFSVLGLDTTGGDEWSHSLVMAVLWSSVFASAFRRHGRAAMGAAWLAIFSHFVLDTLVQGAGLYPHAPVNLKTPPFVTSGYRWVQLALCTILLVIYARDARRLAISPWRRTATCAIVVALNGRFLLGY
ncbi:hypothetical protein LZC95_09375 [Pendulispora brunnea]|uniref:Metal-dependent hydrolase n=1 Tax=Pendulispora brunnea TaxID=2905690 RepID=A0ABZ2KJA7_9BACT